MYITLPDKEVKFLIGREQVAYPNVVTHTHHCSVELGNINEQWSC